jgi:hypothetical protein
MQAYPSFLVILNEMKKKKKISLLENHREGISKETIRRRKSMKEKKNNFGIFIFQNK